MTAARSFEGLVTILTLVVAFVVACGVNRSACAQTGTANPIVQTGEAESHASSTPAIHCYHRSCPTCPNPNPAAGGRASSSGKVPGTCAGGTCGAGGTFPGIPGVGPIFDPSPFWMMNAMRSADPIMANSPVRQPNPMTVMATTVAPKLPCESCNASLRKPGSSPTPTDSQPWNSGSASSVIDNQFYNFIHSGTDIMTVPGTTLGLIRFHRSRDLFVAGSFGQGVVCNFDVRLRLDFDTSNSGLHSDYDELWYSGQLDLDGLSWASIFVPESSANFNFEFDQNNALLPENRAQAKKLEIFDDQMVAVNGVLGTDWHHFPDAKYAVLTNWDGSTMKFELFVGTTDANWDDTLHAPPDGRLIEAKNVDGSGYTISYKTWTQTQIDQSPSRQWQIDKVTDSQADYLTFDYVSTQQNGAWVVDKITLPNSDEVDYTYTEGFLSEVEYPDSTSSTFSFSNAGNGMIRLEIDDLGSEPGSRHVKANVSGSAATVNGVVVPTTVGLARMLRNGEEEVTFLNVANFTSSSSGVQYALVYEGGGMIRAEADEDSSGFLATKRYFKDGWTLSLQNEGYVILVDGNGDPILDQYGQLQYVWQDENPFAGTLEAEYDRVKGSMQDIMRGRPDEVVTPQGIERSYTYDTGGARNLVMTEYADGTISTYCYDSDNQITRYRDRGGNVMLFEYDTKSRLTKMEVGLTDSSTNQPATDSYGAIIYDRCATDDVETSEHAEYTWSYHSSGNGTDRLASFTDALSNVTDYEYDTNDRLKKIKGVADTSSGTRPEYTFLYDSSDRIQKVTNPEGDVLEYFYDSRHRLISTLYDDGSTEKIIYGTTGNKTGLVVKTIDRVGVVTTYDYDDADRLTEVVNAAAQMDGSTETATPAIASTTTYTYIDGTMTPLTVTRESGSTENSVDYRGRVVNTTASPRDGVELVSERTYVDNQLFSNEDPYGRMTYFAYDATDGRLIRTITGTTEEFSLTNFTAVINKTRDLTANADYIVNDTVYNANGSVERIHNGCNAATEYEYDSRGRTTATIADADYTDRGTVSSLATAMELRTETIYDDNNNVTEVRTPRYFDSGDSHGYNKAREQWTYTDRGLRKTHKVAVGATEEETESFVYDLLGRLTERTDFAGEVWKTHFEDCCGKVIASENPLGHGSITRKDAVGRTVHQATIETYSSHTTALDNPVDAKTLREVTTRYDGRGRPTARTTWLTARGVVDVDDPPIAGLDSVSASLGLTEQYLYDDDLSDGAGLDATSGGLTVNQLGGGTYTVNLDDALTKLSGTEANGGAGISFDADAPGSARVMISAEEELRFSISDATGRTVMSGIIEPHDGTNPNDLITWNCTLHDGTTNVSGYGTVLVSKSINALGDVSKQYTDAVGRTIQSLDALDKITSYEYDACGNQTKIRDPNSVGQDCTFDALGRDLTCTDTTSDATSSAYDDNGNKVTSTDANSETTTYDFNARGQQVKQTDRLGGETEFAYNATGQLSSLTDAEDEVTSYTYNDAGGKLTETYPDHTGGTPGQSTYGIITFTLDAAGRTERKQDQTGDTVTYNFDLAGRMTSRDYRTLANSPSGTIADTDTFTYDDASRMLTAVSGRYTNTVTYTYDEAGRKKTEALTIDSVTYTTTTVYNDAGQVSSYTYPDGTDVDRTYTDRGQLHTIAVDSTTVDTRSYDNGGRMTSSVYNNGVTQTRAYNTDNTLASITHTGASIGNYTYGWDDNKNKTSEAITGTMSGYGFAVGSSGYDDEDRLVNWERDDTNLDQSWSLSLVGDWSSITENSSTQLRTHGSAHQILTAASQSITHDMKGNMTSIPAVLRPGSDPLALSWDFDNRMTGADVDNDSTDDVTYQFDALGRRVQRDDGTDETIFVQNGQQTFADYASGTAATSSDYNYVYASYIDEPVYRDGTGGSRYYHRNQQYSVVALTDGSGTIKERYAYTAYGVLSIFDGSGTARTVTAEGNRYTYTGREWDSDLELYHYRARMYDPVSGRFCGRDPIGFLGGHSLYTYSRSSPLVYIDRFGLLEEKPNPNITNMLKGVCRCHAYVIKTLDVPEHVAGTIRCLDGKMSVILFPPREDDDYRKASNECGFAECTKRHEENHILYFKELCGKDFCKGKKCEKDEIYQLTMLGPKHPCGTVLECPAYIVGIDCMVEKVKKLLDDPNAKNRQKCYDIALKKIAHSIKKYGESRCDGIEGLPTVNEDNLELYRRLVAEMQRRRMLP